MSDIYEIRLQGHLDCQWSDWFDGLTIHHLEDGTTVLAGPVADQAALHGLLAKVRDLGIPLLALLHITKDRVAGSSEETSEQSECSSGHREYQQHIPRMEPHKEQ